MWPRFNKEDMLTILHYLGSVVSLVSLPMLFPLVVASVMGEVPIACNFAIGFGVTPGAGSLMRFARVHPKRLLRRQALVTVGIGWLVVAFFGAVPLYLSGGYASPAIALFDSLSALTTTGIVVNDDYNHVAIAVQLWRSLLGMIGGQSIVATVLSLDFFGQGGLLAHRDDPREDQAVSGIVRTFGSILVISVVMVGAGTVLAALICLGIGIAPTRALYYGFCLAVSSFNTSSVTPYSSSLIYFHSWEIELFCLVFMMLGSVGVTTYLCMHGRNSRPDRSGESRLLAFIMSLATVAVVLVLMQSRSFTELESVIRRGMFMAISACTTGGLQTVYPGQMGLSFPVAALNILMILMVVGGSMGSAAGGIKGLRFVMIIRRVWDNIRQILLPPSAMVSQKFRHRADIRFTKTAATTAMMLFCLYIFTGVVGGMVGVAYGYDAVPAMFQSVAFVCDNGMTTSIISDSMPTPLLIIYVLEMYLGRLEFIAVIATVVELFISLYPRKRCRRRARR